MITTLSWDSLNAFGFEALRVVLSVFWQSSVLLGTAGLLAVALRRRSAAIRYRVWIAALLLTPLIPVLTYVGSQIGSPQLHIPIIPAYQAAVVEPFDTLASNKTTPYIEQGFATSPAEDYEESPVQVNPEAQQAAWATEPLSAEADKPIKVSTSSHPWGIALCAYATGLALLLGLVCLGRIRLHRYTRKGQIVTDPRITDVFETARKQMGLKRGCVIVEIDNLHAPLTYRTFHPVMALPHGFTDDLSETELRTIALHELAHVKRQDPLVLNLASIIRAVFFFHPLVWLAAREIAALAEEAADNVVLESTKAPLPYAKMLTRLTEKLTHRMLQTELAVGIVFSKSALLRRIEAILSPRTDQLRNLPFGVIAMTSILVFVSLVLATAMPLTPVSFPTTLDDHAKGMSTRHVLDSALGVGGISRDGRYGSYVDWNTGGHLVVHDFTTGEDQYVTKNEEWVSLPGPNDSWVQTSVISPDNKHIAVMWYLGDPGTEYYTLRVCDMDGSNIRVLHEDKDVPVVTPFDWSPDGENILVQFANKFDNKTDSTPLDTMKKLALVSADDGSVTELKQWKGRPGPRMAELSPDGKYVAFDLWAPAKKLDIYVIELSTGNEVAVVEHPAHDEFMGWTPDGNRILFASDRASSRSLWTIEIADGCPVGSPALVKSDFAGNPVGFSDDGLYYYNEWLEARNVDIAAINKAGTDFEGERQYASPLHVNSTSSSDWSPDGQFLAYMMGALGRGGGSVFGIYSLETGQERIVTPSLHMHFGPKGALGALQWAPDGKSLFVSGSREGMYGRGIYRIDADSGETELIVEMPAPRNPQPSLDGKAIYYIREMGPIVRHDLATGQEEVVYESTDMIFGLDLSPDGKQLVFIRYDTLVVMSADGGEVREVVTFDESNYSNWPTMTWMPDGKHVLTSLKRNSELWRINVETGKQQQIGSTIPGLVRVTMHPDGKRIASTIYRETSETWVVENFLSDSR